ncbi:MAG: biotin/lipoate--protein ligase family protein, partial [Rhodobacter sp.]|nr:biotin/lipoate--protein ligase family protein [Rhodobacter sp.]
MTAHRPTSPDFPPLLTGKPVGARVSPFDKALAEVLTGEVEPGLIHYAESGDVMRAAVTLAPEQPLAQAICAIYAVQLGLADALGALAPPELAVQFDWPATLRVNGAVCGGFRAAASTSDPQAEPDWLIVGVDLSILPTGDDGGVNPDITTLHAEGCVDLGAPMIIESWSRHMLVWIHRYISDGFAPLHEAWRGKCVGIGTEISQPETGLFVGLDER